MRYTLFVFQVEEMDLEAGKRLAELGRLLGQTKTHRADISCGVYVFETQKGWRDMHRLRPALMQKNIDFLELQFEEGLAGCFSQSTRDKLKAIGINDDALFNLSD